MNAYGTDDVTASKTVATLRMVNGQLWLDLPDDPGELEGPSAFSEPFDAARTEEVLSKLSLKARDRIYKLVDAHALDLETAHRQEQTTAQKISDRYADAVRVRGAVDSSRAHP